MRPPWVAGPLAAAVACFALGLGDASAQGGAPPGGSPPEYPPPPPGYPPPPPGYLQPPPGYPPPGYPPAPSPGAQQERSQFSAQFSIGMAVRSLYAIPIYGGDFHISLGGQPSRNLAMYANIDLFLGATEFGLLTSHLRPGFLTLGVFDRVRFGGGFQFGFLSIRRVTRNSTIDDFTMGLMLQLTVDVLRFGQKGAVFLGLSTDLDFLLAGFGKNAGFPAMIDGQLRLGIRL